MELKDFISETIVQIASGVIDATEKCKKMDVIVNPDINIVKKGEYFIPNKGKYSFVRRVQQIDMDICVIVSESETNNVGAKVGIPIIGLGANSSDAKGNTNESRIRFSIPVCLPVSNVDLIEKNK